MQIRSILGPSEKVRSVVPGLEIRTTGWTSKIAGSYPTQRAGHHSPQFLRFSLLAATALAAGSSIIRKCGITLNFHCCTIFFVTKGSQPENRIIWIALSGQQEKSLRLECFAPPHSPFFHHHQGRIESILPCSQGRLS